MMTKDQLKPVMFAWLNDQSIQYRHSGSAAWVDWEPVDILQDYIPSFTPHIDWRIKPEKKLRPWRLEEIPLGLPIRRKSYIAGAAFIILGRFRLEDSEPAANFLCCTIVNKAGAKELLLDYEMLDGKPCGIEE